MKYGLMCPHCRIINNFPQKMPQVPPGKFTFMSAFRCSGCTMIIPVPKLIVLHEIIPREQAKSNDVINERFDALTYELSGMKRPSSKNVEEPKVESNKSVDLNTAGMTVDDLLLSDVMPEKPVYDFCTGDDKCACPNCYDKNGYGV